MDDKLCRICKKRTARYVCQECGRTVCEICLDHHTWLCPECHKRLEEAHEAEREQTPAFPAIFTRMLLLGFILIFLGTATLTAAALTGEIDGSFGFFALIGFIPIALGTGEYAPWIVLIAAVLAIAVIALSIILQRQITRESSAP